MQFDMVGVSVMLAMPAHRDIPPPTVKSLLETQEHFIARGVPLRIEMQWGSSLVHHARSKLAAAFLDTDCSHLVWVDSDIVWNGADFVRLVALGTKMECVSAIYTSKTDKPRFCLSVDDIGAVLRTNEYGCFPLRGGGLGLGFTCVQRQVIDALAKKAPKRRFPDIDRPIPHIFRCDDFGDQARGEDIAFFSDVRDLGYTVHLDPSIVLGHVGPKVYRAAILDHLDHHQSGDLNGTSSQSTAQY